MKSLTIEMLKGTSTNTYYADYPFKGYGTSKAVKQAYRIKQKANLNPKVIWKHLIYTE